MIRRVLRWLFETQLDRDRRELLQLREHIRQAHADLEADARRITEDVLRERTEQARRIQR